MAKMTWDPVVGALITSGTAVLVAIFVTKSFTRATKRTEFFLDFTKRYHAVLVEKHKLDRKFKEAPPKSPAEIELEKADAHQIYFQMFGLIYDEFYAYQNDFLDPEAFEIWMIWQMYDATEGKFQIGGVSYQEGWEAWFANRAVKLHSATPFVQQMRVCSSPESLRSIIRTYRRGRGIKKWVRWR